MRNITIRGTHVRVPSTRDDWELYDNDDAEQAAIDLNHQVDALVEQWTAVCHDGEMAPTRRGIESARRRLFNPILMKHAAAGAQDSEPEGHVIDTIERIARALGGV